MRRIFLAAILTGIVSTMLGPLMPGFESRWNLDDAHGGLLFVAQFVTQLTAAATVGYIGRRIGYWRVAALGLAIAALGVAGCASPSWTMTVLSVAVYGAGIGLAVPASNLGVAAEAGAGESARQVLWLNLFWSVGAVSAPALVASLRGAFLPSVAATLIVMAAVLAFGHAGHPPQSPVASGSEARSPRAPHLLFAVILFLYVGVESAIAGWVSSYATRSATAQRLWAVLPSVFWGSILLGRIIAPNILHKLRPPKLVAFGLATALGGALILVADDGPAALLAGSAIAGLGFAPVFPVVVAAYADLTAGASLSGFIFTAAGLGGASIPWLVGVVSTLSGSLRVGLVTLLALILAKLWLIRTAMPQSDRSS